MGSTYDLMDRSHHFMKIQVITLFATTLGLLPLMAKDVAGAKDPEGFKRITGSEIIWNKEIPFDEFTIALEEYDYGAEKFKDSKKLKLEGAHEVVYYKMQGDGSTLEAIRQYQAELKDEGFETVFEAANDDLDNGYNRFVSTVFPEVAKTDQLQYLHERGG